MPNNILSDPATVSDIDSPADRSRGLLVDYEMGGIAVNDPSEGSQYQVWTLTYEDPIVVATADNGTREELFEIAGITEASLCFDTNMNPFVTYIVGGNAWYWWYDTVAASQVHTQMAAGVVSPRCTLDDKRSLQKASSDIILAYIISGTLYFRMQRDRYGTEYQLATGLTTGLYQIGMGKNLRLHFILSELIP